MTAPVRGRSSVRLSANDDIAGSNPPALRRAAPQNQYRSSPPNLRTGQSENCHGRGRDRLSRQVVADLREHDDYL
ncbi:hypothetical protein ACFRQM_33195 [Streptomyces sp. NPDC056831]|uniref:hypothetical protein n=1 Tax=Streptomyces sp. NPDC056831 TaxID=3345954 RepID=UPI0036B95424